MSSTFSNTLHPYRRILFCATFKSVCLFYCSVEMTDLTDACVEDLCAAIRASKTLKSLELHNNSLTTASIPALIQVMQQSKNMLEMK